MDLELVDRAAHALPGAQRAGAGRDHGAARARRPRQRRDPLLRRRRRRHRRGRRSARSSACSTAKTSGARSPATSATSCSRPARSSSTRPRSKRASTPTGCASASFKVVLDYSFGAASIVMPNVLAQARRRACSRSTRSRAPRRHRPSTTSRRASRRIGDLVRTSGCDLGSCSTPTARPRRSSTTRACRSTAEQALLALVKLVVRGAARARASRCRSR